MATNNTNFNNYNIPSNEYVAFDATSLRQLILDRLNTTQVFTDQNYIGSNLASVIDIVAYTFNTLMYYLNKTASESMFTEAQLYENINRIVKLLDYNPLGYQTSTLPFSATVDTLNAGTYTIPRYTSVSVNGIKFSFNSEQTFVKTVSLSSEGLTELSSQALLYQGSYQEYPLYTAIGDENEMVLLSPATNINIDHFNIDVYVNRNNLGIWSQYTKSNSLYLENSIAEKYEIRLNGNNQYEITFGDDINGVKLQPNDKVAVYYLQSDGSVGEVGKNAITSAKATEYNTTQFNQIIASVLSNNSYDIISNSDLAYISFSNKSASTPVQTIQTPDEIRAAAPSVFRSQYRLVTENDYKSFINTNFSNLISDVTVVDNITYTTQYLQYFYNLGLTDPSLNGRALFNQFQFSDACNFNNVYLFIVPRTVDNTTLSYLLPPQKELITTSVQLLKSMTAEIAYADPVYKAVAIGTNSNNSNTNITVTDESLSRLYIKKNVYNNRDNSSIIKDVINIFTSYFSKSNLTLGQTLDITSLSQQILNINGIDSFYTGRIDNSVQINGLSLFIWNPDYSSLDTLQTTNNIVFNFFEYPYLFDLNNLINKIVII